MAAVSLEVGRPRRVLPLDPLRRTPLLRTRGPPPETGAPGTSKAANLERLIAAVIDPALTTPSRRVLLLGARRLLQEARKTRLVRVLSPVGAAIPLLGIHAPQKAMVRAGVILPSDAPTIGDAPSLPTEAPRSARTRQGRPFPALIALTISRPPTAPRIVTGAPTPTPTRHNAARMRVVPAAPIKVEAQGVAREGTGLVAS